MTREEAIKAVGLKYVEQAEKDAWYMNIATGSVDTYDGWWYENEDGEKVNAVDLGEVVAVYKGKDGAWKEA